MSTNISPIVYPGVALVLVGAFTSACQMIVEEVFIKNRGFHPLQAVGMEGIFGSLMMIAVRSTSILIAHIPFGAELSTGISIV